MKTYTVEEADQYVSDMFSVNSAETDNEGQIIIYTGLYRWSDNTIRDEAQPPDTLRDVELPSEEPVAVVFRGSGKVR
jgi:hypothetical protein